jgi:hypothetical protein
MTKREYQEAELLVDRGLALLGLDVPGASEALAPKPPADGPRLELKPLPGMQGEPVPGLADPALRPGD